MNSYMISILSACILFPLIAAVFTLPFVIVHYRRYGGIPVIRVMIVYSFILYSMCALFLTMLPLPTMSAVQAMKPKPIGWIPGHDLYETMTDAGFSFSDLSTFREINHYRVMLKSFGLFQIAANIVMQIPLGIYLRYYFRCSWKKTLLIGFCVSLFYELTQLSGLWFIYPKAYRYAEVDDLINNTLGCMIGYWITPLFERILPKRDEIDEESYTKGLYVTLARRFFAYLFDSIILLAVNAFFVLNLSRVSSMPWYVFSWILSIVLLLGIIPEMCMDSTVGQLLVRLRLRRDDAVTEVRFFRQLFRNLMVYVLETGMVLISGVFLGLGLYIMSSHTALSAARLPAVLILFFSVILFFWWAVHTQRKYHTLPHSHYTKTVLVPIPVSVRIKSRKDAG